jgi:hypothetical protein
LGDIIKIDTDNTKHKKWEEPGMKKTLICEVRAETRRENVALFHFY